MRSGRAAYSVTPLPVRFHGINEVDTANLRKIYEHVGKQEFVAYDLWFLDGKFQYRKYVRQGYIWKVRRTYKNRVVWVIASQVASRFELDYMVKFDAYRRQTRPYDALQVSKRHLKCLGMSIDGKWCYCKYTACSGTQFVMVGCSDWYNSRVKCAVYRANMEKCQEWLNTWYIAGHPQVACLR